jgi:hypothetical protein
MRTVETTFSSPRASAVIAAFIEVESMRAWWQAERGLVDARVGGVWALSWNDNRYVETGRIEVLEPERRLRIGDLLYFSPGRSILGPMSLDIEVARDVVKITQGGYRDGPDWDWYYESVHAAWPKVAATIRDYITSP